MCASPELAASTAGGHAQGDEKDEGARRHATVFGGKCSGIVVLDEAAAASAATVSADTEGANLTIKELEAPGNEESFEAFLLKQQQRSKQQGEGAATTEGFRLCRDCRQVVLRGQYMDEEVSKMRCWYRVTARR